MGHETDSKNNEAKLNTKLLRRCHKNSTKPSSSSHDNGKIHDEHDERKRIEEKETE